MAIETHLARFNPGTIVMTQGAMDALTQDDVFDALVRHLAGDWGNLDDVDRRQNDLAITHGGRILSTHQSRSDVKFWVITEADRSATTFLLPAEY